MNEILRMAEIVFEVHDTRCKHETFGRLPYREFEALRDVRVAAVGAASKPHLYTFVSMDIACFRDCNAWELDRWAKWLAIRLPFLSPYKYSGPMMSDLYRL